MPRQGGDEVGVKVFGMSLSRLETSQSTPPFYNYIFYCPSFWERSTLNRSKCENSILRKRVYSFKHSGNSRGGHRGPENMCVFCRSGLKMSEFGGRGLWESNFLKQRVVFFSQVQLTYSSLL